MRKYVALLLAGAMALSLAACSSGAGDASSAAGDSAPAASGAAEAPADGGDAASGDPIKVGVLAPLTGDVSVYGNTTKNGIELAIAEINAAGGVLGRPLEANIMDEKGDIAEAVNAYNALVSDEIDVLIGDVTSKPTLAVAELAAADRIPMMCPTGTTPAITTYGDNVYRACYTDPFQGKIMATYAADNLQAKTAAIIYNTSDDYSQGIATAFEETAKEKGLEVVAKEGYGADDKDFKTQLTKIASLNPDVLMVPEYYGKVALIANQARDAGYQNPMLGADGWDGVLGVLDAAKVSVVDNCYFSNHYSTEDTAENIQKFVKAYTDKVGEAPSAFAALGYDSVYMLKQAIEKAGSTDKEAVIAAMKGIDYEGVTGHIVFDENGDPIKSVAVIKLEGGKAVLDSKINP